MSSSSSHDSIVFGSSCPDEVLAHIFEYHCEQSFVPNTSMTSSNLLHRLRKALTLTRVCSNWRTVAIADPWLWGHINLSWHIDAIDACFERSRSVDLNLYLTIDAKNRSYVEPNLEYLQGLISAYMPCIRELHLFLLTQDRQNTPEIGELEEDDDGWGPPSTMMSDFYSPFLTLEAPALMKFSLSLYSRGDDNNHPPVANFLGGRAPNLRHLDLRGVDIPLSGSPFDKLAFLTLDTMGKNGAFYTLKEIVSTLSSFPRLETLHLEHRHEKFTEDDEDHFNDFDPPRAPMVLPFCRDLLLRGLLGRQIVYFFTHVECPSMQTLHMRANLADSPYLPDDVLPPKSALPSCLHPIFEGLQTLEISFDYGSITFESVSENVPFSWQLVCDGIDVSDDRYDRRGIDILDSYFTGCSGVITLLDPVKICLQYGQEINYAEPSKGAWIDFLSHATRVTTLSLKCTPINSLIESLGDRQDICQSLEEIDINRAFFAGKDLKQMLHCRKQKGYGVKRLKLDMTVDRNYPTPRRQRMSSFDFERQLDIADLVDTFTGYAEDLEYKWRPYDDFSFTST
ncbi:hypothetical protein SISNIDRAFT_488310 [Sistotremastrum niveocremeum HHB9708]|uniref:Uncharacterized protein n=1 Tax=Sistotremastrum niveocremeum HHB9708 TaxID=1314777 RepID=A0A164RBS5_9AGAM|nr:hypothetical protein SISNIDRAFT_488310 [Sistotremastrum niveocremeum HHB9708]